MYGKSPVYWGLISGLTILSFTLCIESNLRCGGIETIYSCGYPQLHNKDTCWHHCDSNRERQESNCLFPCSRFPHHYWCVKSEWGR